MEWNRVLIARLSAIGDIVFALPVLTSLRRARPEASIGWLIDDRTSILLRDHPWLDELIIYPRSQLRGWWKRPLRSLAQLHTHRRRLRSKPYDLALELQGNLKCALQLSMLRGARRIGFARAHTRESASAWFSHERVDPGPERIHRIDKFLALLRPLGIEPRREFPPPPRLRPEVVDEARRIAAIGRERGGPLVALHPFVSHYGRDKEWPLERFATLAQRLRAEFDATCVIIRAPAEHEPAARLVELSAGAAQDAAPRTDLAVLLALLGEIDLFIGCDSGPLHLSTWQRRPCIGLYGPTDPLVYGPAGARSQVIFHGEDPPPPRQRTLASPTMLRIEVDEVFEACQRALASS